VQTCALPISGSAVEEARAAQAELEQFDSVIQRLATKRNEQRRLIAELDDPEQHQKLTQLEADLDRAKTAGQALRTADVLLREAAGERSRLEERETVRRELRTQVEQAEQAATTARSAAENHDPVLETARQSERSAAAALEAARTALRT